MKNLNKLNMGKLIYNFRNKKKITQEMLADGICSTSYLSKIENEQIIASEEIIYLLLKKLEVNIEEIYNNTEIFNSTIEKISKAIDFKEFKKADSLLAELENISQEINNPSFLCDYYLIKLKFFFLQNSLEHAKNMIEFLNELYKRKTIKQEYLFQNLIGIYYCKQKKYTDGLDYFKSANLIGLENNLDLSENYYNLALTYSHLHNISLTIYYCERALELYQKNLNYLKSLDCQIIIGINLVRIKKYSEAKQIYLKALDQSEMFNLPNTKAIIYHNLGYIYYCKQNYNEALKYFIKSLDNKNTDSESYLCTIYYLCNTLLESSKENEFQFWIKKVENTKYKDSEYYYLLNILKLKNKNFEEYIEYCENIAFPYFLKNKNYTNALKVGNVLGDYYSSIRMYKKANKIYKDIISINNTININ